MRSGIESIQAQNLKRERFIVVSRIICIILLREAALFFRNLFVLTYLNFLLMLQRNEFIMVYNIQNIFIYFGNLDR